MTSETKAFLERGKFMVKMAVKCLIPWAGLALVLFLMSELKPDVHWLATTIVYLLIVSPWLKKILEEMITGMEQYLGIIASPSDGGG
ncbi:MAG: hypothetical protein LBJ12_01905 [Oscillospiraceae bacterium]|jgi:uncharacterized membrane protein|nr:hypothetical protein [Oscillospiraceae bacterium]